MGLKATGAVTAESPIVAAAPAAPVKSYGESKDARILYQGLTQAALTSMPLGQFSVDVDSHIANVKKAVIELAEFVLERSK